MCLPLLLGPAAAAAGAGAGATAAAVGTAAAATSAASAASALFTLQSIATVGASLVSYIGQKSQADAQSDANRASFQQAQDLATSEALDTYNTENSRIIQQRRASSIEIRRVVGQSLIAAGTARAGAAKAGVGGAAIQSLLRDFERKENDFRTGTLRNLRASETQSERTKSGAQTRARGRVLAATPDPVQQPSFLGAALRAGGGVVSAFQQNTFIDATGSRQFGALSNA